LSLLHKSWVLSAFSSAVLGLEPRASRMLGRWSVISLSASVLFLLCFPCSVAVAPSSLVFSWWCPLCFNPSSVFSVSEVVSHPRRFNFGHFKHLPPFSSPHPCFLLPLRTYGGTYDVQCPCLLTVSSVLFLSRSIIVRTHGFLLLFLSLVVFNWMLDLVKICIVEHWVSLTIFLYLHFSPF
jgi:hypothetical protein